MKLVLIHPGKFMMGEGPQKHEVTISKPFYRGVTEVTQGQYEAVMDTNPSQFKSATIPVEMVYSITVPASKASARACAAASPRAPWPTQTKSATGASTPTWPPC